MLLLAKMSTLHKLCALIHQTWRMQIKWLFQTLATDSTNGGIVEWNAKRMRRCVPVPNARLTATERLAADPGALINDTRAKLSIHTCPACYDPNKWLAQPPDIVFSRLAHLHKSSLTCSAIFHEFHDNSIHGRNRVLRKLRVLRQLWFV